MPQNIENLNFILKKLFQIMVLPKSNSTLYSAIGFVYSEQFVKFSFIYLNVECVIYDRYSEKFRMPYGRQILLNITFLTC